MSPPASSNDNQDQGFTCRPAHQIKSGRPPRPRPPAAPDHLTAGAVYPAEPSPATSQHLSAPPIPHPAAAATDPLASNNHYSYCQFNTQYMLFSGE